jgi:hypothetical protein
MVVTARARGTMSTRRRAIVDGDRERAAIPEPALDLRISGQLATTIVVAQTMAGRNG